MERRAVLMKDLRGLYLNGNAALAVWLLKVLGLPDAFVYLHIDYSGRYWAGWLVPRGERLCELYMPRWLPAPLMAACVLFRT